MTQPKTPCTKCGSTGFNATETGCEFCDGTASGNVPTFDINFDVKVTIPARHLTEIKEALAEHGGLNATIGELKKIIVEDHDVPEGVAVEVNAVAPDLE